LGLKIQSYIDLHELEQLLLLETSPGVQVIAIVQMLAKKIQNLHTLRSSNTVA